MPQSGATSWGMDRVLVWLTLWAMASAGCLGGRRSVVALPVLSPQPAGASGMAPSGCQTVYQYGSRHGWGGGVHCQ